MESEPVTPQPEPEEIAAENEGPALYNPKMLSLVSSLANVFSWLVLVGFIGNAVAQYVSLNDQLTQNSLQFMTLLKEQPGFPAYLLTNFGTPLFTGLTFFLVLQGVAIGLNVLLEIDLKTE